MKLRRGKPRYSIPDHSEILGVWIEGNQKHNQMHHIRLMQVPLDELSRTDLLAVPSYFSVLRNIIEFHPVPDKPYIVKVRYTPPVKEF